MQMQHKNPKLILGSGGGVRRRVAVFGVIISKNYFLSTMTHLVELRNQTGNREWGCSHAYIYDPKSVVADHMFDEAVALRSVSIVLKFKNSSHASILKTTPWYDLIQEARIERLGSTIAELVGGKDSIGLDMLCTDSFPRQNFVDRDALVVPIPLLTSDENNFFELEPEVHTFMITLADAHHSFSIEEYKLQIEYTLRKLPLCRQVYSAPVAIFHPHQLDFNVPVYLPPMSLKSHIRFATLIIRSEDSRGCLIQEAVDMFSATLVLKTGEMAEHIPFVRNVECWRNALDYKSNRCAAELSTINALLISLGDTRLNKLLQNPETNISIHIKKDPNKNYAADKKIGVIRVIHRFAYDSVVEKFPPTNETISETKSLEERVARLERLVK